ncbi:V-type proton ATPase 16 kDa proteolipid subunit [Drosophila eugracilis]|uniref:V-type proton ATPase 16 kDa proteolipid subunit n=1 Tax=Drosophila eugracilis TaxID=29029 RepID=UPI0007E80E8A|nr:V-type proton ATPase 16 kDa proteolipid subunit [Drosophila eugracilis]
MLDPVEHTLDQPAFASFFCILGAVSAIVFSTLGAAYGTAKASVGISSMAIKHPQLLMKAIVPVVMAGIIAIYGLVIAVLLAGSLHHHLSAYKGFLNLSAGLAVGVSGMAAGIAIGVVGEAGVRASAQQPKVFVAIILVLIFAEVLGLYGLIVAIYLFTK